MTTPLVLGIDFGTCRTSAAVVIGGKFQPLVFGKSRSNDFPTAVLWKSKGNVLVGEEAIQGAQSAAGSLFQEFKLKVGRRDPLEVDGEALTYTDLVATVLERVRLTAEKEFNNGQSIASVCITVPALYSEGGDAWRVMEEAARGAGFHDVRLLREPQAAALYYDWLLRQEIDSAETGSITLVYDLGGGTFDPALIQRSGQVYRILGAHSSEGEGVHCGGVIFDERIRQDFRTKCPGVLESVSAPSSHDETTAQRRARYRDALALKEFLLDVKLRLSEPGVEVFEEGEPIEGGSYRLVRSEFEGMIAPLLDQTLASCDRLVHSAGIDWKQVTRILMVGGSCHIPLVRKKLEAYAKDMGASPEICWRRIGTTDKLYDPLLAVCYGAALEGNGDVDFQQAMFALDGDRSEAKDRRAFQLLQRAGRAGHAEANFRLASLYDAGRGCKADIGAALRCILASAEAGFAPAQSDLGLRYHKGIGTPPDFDKARVWFRKAIEQGDEEAKVRLKELEEDNPNGWFAKGEKYRTGDGVTADMTEAVKWYRNAAEAGHCEAKYILGARNFLQLGGPNGTPEEGFDWLQKAANQGHVEAKYWLGVSLRDGVGCKSDLKIAKQLFQELTSKRHHKAKDALEELCKIEAAIRTYARKESVKEVCMRMFSGTVLICCFVLGIAAVIYCVREGEPLFAVLGGVFFLALGIIVPAKMYADGDADEVWKLLGFGSCFVIGATAFVGLTWLLFGSSLGMMAFVLTVLAFIGLMLVPVVFDG